MLIDQPGYEFRRDAVEVIVAHLHAGRRFGPHLPGCIGFRVVCGPGIAGELDACRGDPDRFAKVSCSQGQQGAAGLVHHAAIQQHGVGPKQHAVAALHGLERLGIGQQADGNARCSQLPGQPAAFAGRTAFAHQDLPQAVPGGQQCAADRSRIAQRDDAPPWGQAGGRTSGGCFLVGLQTVEQGVREIYQALKFGEIENSPRCSTVKWYRHILEAKRLLSEIELDGRLL